MEQATSLPAAEKITLDAVVDSFGDLATLAPAAMEVVRLADDEDATVADLVQVISMDPGLTARLLRLANSAAYSPVNEITSLDRATAMLGVRTVKLVSLGFTLVDNLQDGPVDTSTIWRRALSTSVLARELTDRVNKRFRDDAFVAGLLGQIGKLALLRYPVYANVVLERGPWLTAHEERALLGFSSDEVSARVLETWRMPPVVADAVRYRHDPYDAGLAQQQAALLGLADATSVFLVIDDERRSQALDALIVFAATHLGYTLSEVEDVIETVTPELDEIASMFDFETVTRIPFTELVVSAQQQLIRLSLDMTNDLVSVQQQNRQLVHDNEKLAEQAMTDPLTGLPNRRTFEAFLANQVSARKRRARDSFLGLIVLDLDHFKGVNDTYGHDVGDEVLRALGHLLQRSTRSNELTSRLGGEEFAIVLPDTDPGEIVNAAERFRQAIAEGPFECSVGPVPVTASFGAALAADIDDQTPDRLYTSADRALYEAKAAGRNRTVVGKSV